jgi:hypothetical protein
MDQKTPKMSEQPTETLQDFLTSKLSTAGQLRLNGHHQRVSVSVVACPRNQTLMTTSAKGPPLAGLLRLRDRLIHKAMKAMAPVVRMDRSPLLQE